MKYFSKEIQKDGYIYKTAGVKARDDVDAILRDAGFKELLFNHFYVPNDEGS